MIFLTPRPPRHQPYRLLPPPWRDFLSPTELKILDGTVFDWRCEASRVYAKACQGCPQPVWDGEKHECHKPPAQTAPPSAFYELMRAADEALKRAKDGDDR